MRLTFRLRYHTHYGQSLWLTGNDELFGKNPAGGAIPLQYLNEEFWEATLAVAPGAPLDPGGSYHYLLREADGAVVQDWGGDGRLDLAALKADEVLILDSWNPPGQIENVFYTEPFKQVLLKGEPPRFEAPDQPFLNFGANPFSLSLWAKGPAAQSESGRPGLQGSGRRRGSPLPGYSERGLPLLCPNSAGQIPVGATIQTAVSPNGQWQHLAVSYDPAQSQSRLYLNGVLEGTGATVDSILSNSDPLDIGARQFQGGYTLPWTGLLDDVRLYNRAITPLEVRALTYQGYPPRLGLSANGGQVTVSWPFEAVSYELQTSPRLDGSPWNVVPGVTTNSMTLSPTNAASFYRLHRKVLF